MHALAFFTSFLRHHAALLVGFAYAGGLVAPVLVAARETLGRRRRRRRILPLVRRAAEL
jgi:hypothetical protein